MFLADRVVVVTPPGRVAEIVPTDLPRPRTATMRLSPEFGKLVRKICELIGISYE